MAAPWEKYQTKAPSGPWGKYAAPEAQDAAQEAPKDVGTVPVDGSMVAVDDMLFGLPGKAASALSAGIRAPFTDKSFGEEYSTLRKQYNNARDKFAEDHPAANVASSIAGSVVGGDAVGKLGGMAIAKVAPQVANLASKYYVGKVAGDTVSGMAQGAASAYGHDQNVGAGTVIGGVTGAVSRPIMSAGGAALNAVGGMLGIRNASRAEKAIAEALGRSGKSADEVANALSSARADGQDMFTVADALGNSGQRMLTGIARAPGDSRQAIAESLLKRQSGQGDRLSQAVAEGFNAPDTAAQRVASLKADRKMLANVNYPNAEATAKGVDVSGAIRAADDVLRPGVNKIMSPASGLADDSTDALLKQYRARLTNGREVLTDFNEVRKLKSDITDKAKALRRAGEDEKASTIETLAKRLDAALEASSPDYRAANDAFRAQSRTMEAVEKGSAWASGRVRSADSIQQFKGMKPGEQDASRVGYADRVIAKIEASAGSPTTNKARSLISPKNEEEFAAFAIPQRAARLGRRIGREQTMFETANQALGGSRTADNLADMMDGQSFDPTMIGALASGNIKGAALQGLIRAVQSVQGRNGQTRDMIGKVLMESGPTEAKAAILKALMRGQKSAATQNMLTRAAVSAGAAVPALVGR